MSDANAGNGKRTGRPPKDENERRVPLSLRIDPELRKALEAAAKDENRSLTQLSEFALADFLEARKAGRSLRDASAPVSPAAPALGPGRRCSSEAVQFSLQRALAMLEAGFGRQIAVLACSQAYAMLIAELDSIAWSRDVTERSQQFPGVRGHEGSALRQRQMTALWDFLHQSSPAHGAEQPWLSDDPYVFGQVANAARHVLETLAPEGDPSPPKSPRGVNRAEAVAIMKDLGENAASFAMDQLISDGPPALRRGTNEPAQRYALNEISETDLAWLRQCLGEPVVARLKQRLDQRDGPDPIY